MSNHLWPLWEETSRNKPYEMANFTCFLRACSLFGFEFEEYPDEQTTKDFVRLSPYITVAHFNLLGTYLQQMVDTDENKCYWIEAQKDFDGWNVYDAHWPELVRRIRKYDL